MKYLYSSLLYFTIFHIRNGGRPDYQLLLGKGGRASPPKANMVYTKMHCYRSLDFLPLDCKVGKEISVAFSNSLFLVYSTTRKFVN